MIIQEEKTNLQTYGLTEDNVLRVKLSAKIFKLLTQDLYSDTYTSLLRELGCNAADSHVQAGKPDEPFEVKLPNALEPNLIIRDNGIGLTADEVTNIYMVLGESNKTDSNDLTGCMGIGSKVIFSYTDNATISVRRDGVETFYALYINKDGLPCCPPVSSRPTKECNGVEIKIPVKTDDYYKFVGAATSVFSWFRIKPKVTGSPNFKFLDRDYIYKTDKFGICKIRSNKSYVVMGNVGYLLNCDGLGYHFKNKELVEHGIDLFAPIGSITFTSNRETLLYDEKTKKYIEDSLTEAVEHTRTEISKELDTIQSRLELRRKVAQVAGSGLYRVCKIDYVERNGEKIYGFINTAEENYKYKTSTDNNPISIKSLQSSYSKKNRNSLRLNKHNNAISVNIGYVFIVDDLPKGGLSRLKYFWETKASLTNDKYYFIEKAPPDFIKKEELDSMIIKTSTFDKPPKVVRVSVKAKDSTLYKYEKTARTWGYCSKFWLPEKIDLKQGGIYILLDRFLCEINGIYNRPNNLMEKIDCCERITKKNVVVYGIRKADEPKLLKSKGAWVKFDEFVKSVIKKYEKYSKYLQKDQLSTYIGHSFNIFNMYKNLLNKENPLLKFFEELEDYQNLKNVDIVEDWKSLNKTYDIVIPDIKDTETLLKNIIKEIYKKYPILSYIGCPSSSSSKACVDYMNMVDESLTLSGV